MISNTFSGLNHLLFIQSVFVHGRLLYIAMRKSLDHFLFVWGILKYMGIINLSPHLKGLNVGFDVARGLIMCYIILCNYSTIQ